MSFELQEVHEADFPAIIHCMWYAFENPVQNFYRIFAPSNANGCKTREESIEESIKRFWEWHVSDPSSHWLKVVKKDDDHIVGAALWKINKSNPYQKTSSKDKNEQEKAYWHPPGGQRKFASQVLAKHEAVRSELATRPHLYLNIIFTHPHYQRKGVGSQLLGWGITKAAELGVEIWLDAMKYGRPLYEKHGFVTIEHHIVRPQTTDPDEAWQACEREFTDLEEWVMWRPKEGPYVQGESIKPWEVMQ